MNSVRVHRVVGHSRRRPKRLGGDKAYHARRIRKWLRDHGIAAVIPSRRQRGKRRPGRLVSYDRARYKGRNVIERSLGWLKECHSLATRFEKLAVHFLGMVIWPSSSAISVFLLLLYPPHETGWRTEPRFAIYTWLLKLFKGSNSQLIEQVAYE